MAPTSAVTFTPLMPPVQISASKATVSYEPGVYHQTGEEQRVNLTIKCDDDVLAQIREVESGLDASLVSCLKDAGLRCKIDKRTVFLWDASGAKASAPDVWRGCLVMWSSISQARGERASVVASWFKPLTYNSCRTPRLFALGEPWRK